MRAKKFELQAAKLTLAGNIATAAIARARIAAQIETTALLLANLEEQRDIARERVRLGNAAPDELFALETQTEQLSSTLYDYAAKHSA